ncbi:MAG: N-acetyltransferase [Salinivirgaceae bacterium]|nr:MAG: N-acetyltransferase [Salinivirgaceae bacterium]
MELKHNVSKSRYEFYIEGFTPHLEYEIKENKIYLTHTRVSEELRGQGIAGKLVSAVLEELHNSEFKIIPVCDYVKAFIEKHPEWKQRI